MTMLFGIVLGFAAGLLLFIGTASLPDSRKNAPASPEPPRIPPTSATPWEELAERAQRVVDAAQAELPPEVRAEAMQVPTLLEEWHPTRPRVLGVYYNQPPTDLATRKGPIVLYLRAIERWTARCALPFDEQVRLTYLHEFGHHVGWNEGQVRERDL